MAEKILADYLFSNTKFGLQRVYSILNKTDLDGVSLSDIENADSELSINDIPFAQYLYQNIEDFDADSNKVISSEELQNKLSAMENEGLTYAQLIALQENGLADANSALSKLIEHFKEIDRNNDGRVTKAELNSYNVEQEIQEKENDLTDFKASNITIFYDDSSSELNS